MFKKALILMGLVAMGACGGEPPGNPLDHVTKFGGTLPPGSPMPSELWVSTSQLRAGETWNFSGNSGYGFVEFARGTTSGDIGPSGSRLAQGSGWTYDAQASFTLDAGTTNCPDPFCRVGFSTFRKGAPATAPGNGPALVCHNLHTSSGWFIQGVFASINPPVIGGNSYTFPISWMSTGDQWTKETWSFGQADQSAGAGGLACGWDFEFDQHKLVTIQQTDFATFTPRTTGAYTATPAVLWFSVYFSYNSGGVDYEYHVVQPLNLTQAPPVLP
jgi:hypothetical protein